MSDIAISAHTIPCVDSRGLTRWGRPCGRVDVRIGGVVFSTQCDTPELARALVITTCHALGFKGALPGCDVYVIKLGEIWP